MRGALLLCAVAWIGCGGDDEIARERDAIEAACYDEGADSAWKCGESRVVECGDPLTLYVPRPWAGGDCSDLVVTPNVTWPPGRVDVEVTRPGAGAPICSAELVIRDTIAPAVEPRNDIILWPPNGRFVELAPSDCAGVFDRCDDDVRAEFTWISSDEHADDNHDGRPERDVMIECERVRVSAERHGGGNGRVYRIGVRAFDDSGHVIDGSCTVQIPHDVSGDPAIEDAPSYRIEAGGCARIE